MEYKAFANRGRLMPLLAPLALVVVGCGEKQPENTDAVQQSFSATELLRAASEEHQSVARLMQRHNISRLERLVTDSVETTSRLLDRDGAELGRLFIRYSEEGEETIRLEGLGKKFSVTLGKKRLEYRDHLTGRRGLVQPSDSERRLVADKGANQIKLDVGEDLLKLAAGISSVLHADDATSAQPTAESQADVGSRKSALFRCTGRIVGSPGFARSKMWSCRDAYAKNAVKCTNLMCYGCCAHLGCDSWCWLGDFHCYSYAESRACGY